MENILVSACLLGRNCRYKGDGCLNQKVCDLANEYNLIPICPECDGGLPTPRLPSEIVGEKVLAVNGADNTQAYKMGAEHALKLAIAYEVAFAVLKARSPSCGSGKIYDGTFSGTLKEGDGITAKLLKQHGIRVITEEEL